MSCLQCGLTDNFIFSRIFPQTVPNKNCAVLPKYFLDLSLRHPQIALVLLKEASLVITDLLHLWNDSTFSGDLSKNSTKSITQKSLGPLSVYKETSKLGLDKKQYKIFVG